MIDIVFWLKKMRHRYTFITYHLYWTLTQLSSSSGPIHPLCSLKISNFWATSYPPLSKLPLCFIQCEAIAISIDCTLILFTGPKLPMKLNRHAMVQLGNGLAIIGGVGTNHIQAKIHHLSCINRKCKITTLSQELSVPRYWFLAIPIPDKIAGCIIGNVLVEVRNAKRRILIYFLF